MFIIHMPPSDIKGVSLGAADRAKAFVSVTICDMHYINPTPSSQQRALFRKYLALLPFEKHGCFQKVLSQCQTCVILCAIYPRVKHGGSVG